MSFLKNRSTEKDLRDWFTRHGWDGKSGRFDEIELVAIQRPGWVQVFQFTGTMLDSQDEKQKICGYCRDDERRKQFDVVYGDSLSDLHKIFAEWTSELVTRKTEELHPVQIGLVLFFLGGLALLVILLIITKGNIAS